MPSPASERHGLGFRRLALLCSALLSCTTIRTPVSTIEPDVTLREGRPEPQLELWVESNRRLTPAEEERFRAEARAAIDEALAGRPQPDDEGELLVIRMQGVTRTSGHKGDQVSATAGIVVGAVAVVAAAVVGVAAGTQGHGGGGSHGTRAVPSASAPRFGGTSRSIGHAAPSSVARVPPRFSAPAPRATVPAPRFPVASAPSATAGARPSAVATRSAFPSAAAPHWPVVSAPGAPFAPAPYHDPSPAVDVEVGFWWTLPYSPGPVETYVYELPGPEAGPAPAEPPAEDWETQEAERDVYRLAPPDRYPVEDRGFFDGDRLVLEAVVMDRASGEALWVKRVSRKADPRDASGVRAAMDALLSDGGWQPPDAE